MHDIIIHDIVDCMADALASSKSNALASTTLTLTKTFIEMNHTRC